MRKLLIIFITLASVISLVSCSWLTSFYVVNKSDNPIVLTYRYKQYQNLKPDAPACDESKEISTCKEEGGNCRSLRPEEYKYDKDKCEMELTLAPGEAVKVAKICCTYTGPDERFEGRFAIGEFTIKTPRGLVRYEGFELLKAFKKRDKTMYVLEYR